MAPTTGETGCIAWPEPELARFPCGEAIEDETVETWEPVATQMMYAETGQRFPGTECTALIRVRGIVGCGGSFSEADLASAIPYPSIELLEVNVDGVDVPDAVDQYWIRGGRFLVVDPAFSMHEDDPRKKPGSVGTTSFRIRFGRAPEPPIVAARDELLWTLIMGNEPPSESASHAIRVVDGVTTLTENGRTVQIDRADGGSELLGWARKSYPRRTQHKSRIFDPAEAHYRPTIELIPEFV